MRRIYFIYAITVITLFPARLAAQAAFAGFAVVELFTSQGCSTCPAADKVLSSIIRDAKAKNLPVFGISFHVDYWNKLGWKDPYSSFQYTNRQRNYASVLRLENVYTPQLIINGTSELTGSDKPGAWKIIDKNLNAVAPARVSFTAEEANDTLVVNYEVAFSQSNKQFRNSEYITVVLTQKEGNAKVSKGENAGLELHHHNIARLLQSASVNAATGVITIPLKGLRISGKDKEVHNMVVFIQDKRTRAILGASGKSLE